MSADSWFVVRAPVADPALRLLCLPYAGGNAGAFERWRTVLPHSVEVVAVQFPGRRERIGEPPARRMSQLVAALGTAASPLLDRPYAVYGDCLGAYVGFELVRWLLRRGQSAPRQLVVSSAAAPHVAEVEPDYAAMTDDEFLAELVRLGTMPPHVRAHAELAAAALPSARADFELGRAYRYRPGPVIPVPITAITGADDPFVPAPGVAAWAELTMVGLDEHRVAGGHDLLSGDRSDLAAVVGRTVAATVSTNLSTPLSTVSGAGEQS